MDLFIKKNSSGFSDQLLCEAKGLEQLRSYSKELMIPEVIEVDQASLKMTQVNSRPFDKAGWTKLGRGLAKLHEHNGRNFGLDHDNYIGLNPQINSESQNWGEFFVINRLSMQVDFVLDAEVQRELRSILNSKAARVIDFLNSHGPSISPVHGDLWSGNVMYDGESAWLIDPAFYWGDREVDLAMTELFGRFGEAFYEAYKKELSFKEGHESRKAIYNLYHYLNHYNLFGSSYLGQVRAGFRHLKNFKRTLTKTRPDTLP